MTDFIFSDEFRKAVANIQTRAERQDSDLTKELQEVFVDYGLLVQVNTNKNQILMGRRGTGKTHLLLAMKSAVLAGKGLFVYMDFRKLASGPFEFSEKPEVTARKMFFAFLNNLVDTGMEEVLRLESPSEAKRKASEEAWHKMASLISSNEFKPVTFCGAFEYFLHTMGYSHCMIALDEWVALPPHVQPFFSEFLKHTFIPSRKVCLKIASIDFQSSFSERLPDGRIHGLELGADISTDINMDTILIYDKEKASVCRFFSKMLFNHLLIDGELKSLLRRDEKFQAMDSDEQQSWLVTQCFSQEKAFAELVRACEGVPRDFLQIFVKAYFNLISSKEKERGKIDLQLIRKSSRDWYLNDKYRNISDDKPLSDLLEAVISDVIGNHKARTFLVSQHLSRHPLLLRLFDARLIHLLRRGWSHKDKPGQRFDIFSIDYGTYVDLINTERQPCLDFSEKEDLGKTITDTVVPFDDFRSIRRIELTSDILDRFAVG